ncbi:MAG: hypothetical protein H0X37_10900 [Herpetosiphonaceae bacterium]|nr:hypothetical protein [Herpetosiphonaceae bacterium]
MAQVQILYVATANGLHQFANPGKSDRWRPVGEALNGEDVRAVVAAFDDPLTAYAGSGAGVAQTTDGGASWTTILKRAVTALAITSSGSLHAATADGALLRMQYGPSWEEVTRGSEPLLALSVAHGEQVSGGQRPAVSLGDTDQLYTTTETGLSLPDGALPLDPPPTGALVLLPAQTPTLLVATQGSVMFSDDGGHTLQSSAGPQDVQVLVTPARFQDFAYAGTASGELWLTKDRGRSWTQLHAGLPPVRALSFARVM